MRKSAGSAEKFSSRLPLLPIKGKYGEPVHWDGFVGAVHSFGGA